jgi:hypothetical protein
MESVKKHPPALNAVDHIVAQYTYGDLIPDDVILGLLDLDVAAEDVVLTEQGWRDRSFALLRGMDMIRSELLENHRMVLVREMSARGYTIVMPAEQTRRAMVELQNGFKKVTRKAMKRLSYINREMLTIEQERENSEAMAKLALLSKAGKRQLGFSHRPKSLEDSHEE